MLAAAYLGLLPAALLGGWLSVGVAAQSVMLLLHFQRFTRVFPASRFCFLEDLLELLREVGPHSSWLPCLPSPVDPGAELSAGPPQYSACQFAGGLCRPRCLLACPPAGPSPCRHDVCGSQQARTPLHVPPLLPLFPPAKINWPLLFLLMLMPGCAVAFFVLFRPDAAQHEARSGVEWGFRTGRGWGWGWGGVGGGG